MALFFLFIFTLFTVWDKKYGIILVQTFMDTDPNYIIFFCFLFIYCFIYRQLEHAIACPIYYLLCPPVAMISKRHSAISSQVRSGGGRGAAPFCNGLAKWLNGQDQWDVHSWPLMAGAGCNQQPAPSMYGADLVCDGALQG